MNETKVLRAESIGGATGLQGADRFLRIAEVSHRVGLGKSMIYDLIEQSGRVSRRGVASKGSAAGRTRASAIAL